eukprot:CAMPEP_0113318070 /NCGR_PEP_ID=MMETSP0010_2-20120614/12764_1 /TAXON_ID=216773 ORGANISM="Corethron hystrix, Strain 308" /NCGR_SAMPLE_ID=MMETSP0010_2 /ASSEMBLY_ACC=CAM_ASM_000155 /LENGTH=84 /DNA_ID=CAMNT_0000175255 /DNA_START=370 /DNA_END=624 /DNA_ORIENTATION=- /assembly_acc=CAM_ASM_000155
MTKVEDGGAIITGRSGSFFRSEITLEEVLNSNGGKEDVRHTWPTRNRSCNRNACHILQRNIRARRRARQTDGNELEKARREEVG